MKNIRFLIRKLSFLVVKFSVYFEWACFHNVKTHIEVAKCRMQKTLPSLTLMKLNILFLVFCFLGNTNEKKGCSLLILASSKLIVKGNNISEVCK